MLDHFAFFPDKHGAHRDVAQQAPFIRIIDAARVAQFLELADVVQHHSREQ